MVLKDLRASSFSGKVSASANGRILSENWYPFGIICEHSQCSSKGGSIEGRQHWMAAGNLIMAVIFQDLA